MPKILGIADIPNFDDRAFTIIDPFCGGLGSAFRLASGTGSTAKLSDLNPHLVNLYRQLKSGFKFELDLVNDEATYYEYRDIFNGLIATDATDGPLAATLFYYLNRTGFNGLCRYNRKGFFNAPYGKYKKVNYGLNPRGYVDYFRGWEFKAQSYRSALNVPMSASQSLVYLDPPYHKTYTAYTSSGFTWEDQVELATIASKLDAIVIASNSASPEILELYRDLGFNVETIQAARTVAANGDRTPALEMVAVRIPQRIP
jgi:DNA adenine methylase